MGHVDIPTLAYVMVPPAVPTAGLHVASNQGYLNLILLQAILFHLLKLYWVFSSVYCVRGVLFALNSLILISSSYSCRQCRDE